MLTSARGIPIIYTLEVYQYIQFSIIKFSIHVKYTYIYMCVCVCVCACVYVYILIPSLSLSVYRFLSYILHVCSEFTGGRSTLCRTRADEIHCMASGSPDLQEERMYVQKEK